MDAPPSIDDKIFKSISEVINENHNTSNRWSCLRGSYSYWSCTYYLLAAWDRNSYTKRDCRYFQYRNEPVLPISYETTFEKWNVNE